MPLKNIIIRFVPVLLSVVLFGACSSDDNGEDSADTSRKVQVEFTMSVDRTSEAAASLAKGITRAASDEDQWTSEDDREKGNDLENYVDPTRLHVVFYDNSGNQIGEVTDVRLLNYSSPTTEDYKWYDVVGNLEVQAKDITSDGRLNGRIVVYANVDSPNGGWAQTLQSISSAFTYSYSGSNPTAIPMWGFKNIDIALKPGDRADIGDINLLRAMAKVTVKLTDDMINRGYTLDNVTLNNYNGVGYVTPPYDNFSSLTGTEVLTMQNSFNVNTTSASNGTVAFALAENNDSTQALYIPEYNNETQTLRTSVSVRIKQADGSFREATFDFGAYTDGNLTSSMNIVRNHHYVFNVYGNPIKVVLKVDRWTVFRHEPYTL